MPVVEQEPPELALALREAPPRRGWASCGNGMEWKRKPPDEEGCGGEILGRYERGVMLLLFILAVTIVALIIWLGAYFFGI